MPALIPVDVVTAPYRIDAYVGPTRAAWAVRDAYGWVVLGRNPAGATEALHRSDEAPGWGERELRTWAAGTLRRLVTAGT